MFINEYFSLIEPRPKYVIDFYTNKKEEKNKANLIEIGYKNLFHSYNKLVIKWSSKKIWDKLDSKY